MYRLLGENESLEGLPFAAQVFLRALDGIRTRLAADAGVLGIELRALSHLAEQTGITSASLGGFLELSPAAAGPIFEALASRGLVTATGDADTPHSVLELTSAGHDLVAKTSVDFQRSVNDAASALDEDRRWGLESGMLKMARKLDAETAEAAPR
jgi:DNA-binding MarR family transcriptional regulator